MRYYVTRTNVMTGSVHYLRHNPPKWSSVIFESAYGKARCGKYRKKFANRHVRRLNAMLNPLMRKNIIYGLEAAE